jgi:hypothetical protein
MQKPNPQTTFYDMKGRPIIGGDLLRQYHFTGRRKKIHYLYHVAVPTKNGFDLVPTSHLDPSRVAGGGRCRMTQETASTYELVHMGGLPAIEDRKVIKP